MTRQECEKLICDKLEEIRVISQEYNPGSDYISAAIRNDCVSFNNRHWKEDEKYPLEKTIYTDGGSFSIVPYNEPEEGGGRIRSEWEHDHEILKAHADGVLEGYEEALSDFVKEMRFYWEGLQAMNEIEEVAAILRRRSRTMTIDEAIAHAREVAELQREKANNITTISSHKVICNTCAKEHEQLAEWLEELKELRAEKLKEQEEAQE